MSKSSNHEPNRGLAGKIRLLAAFAIVAAALVAVVVPRTDTSAKAQTTGFVTAQIEASAKLEGQFIVPGLVVQADLEGQDGAPTPQDTSVSFDFANVGSKWSLASPAYNELGPEAFGTIPFTETGTYCYTVSARVTGVDGYVLEQDSYPVEIVVAAGDSGALTATVVYPDDASDALFTVSKNAAPLVFDNVKIGLEFVSIDSSKIRHFDFKLVESPETAATGAVTLKDSSGNVVDSLSTSFDLADDQLNTVVYNAFGGSVTVTKPGLYKLYASQIIPDAVEGVEGFNNQNVIDGVTYDRTTPYISLYVYRDVATGELVGKVTYNIEADKTVLDDNVVAFQNTYSVLENSFDIQVEKDLVGRDWTDSDSFSFSMLDAATGAIKGTASATKASPDPAFNIYYLPPDATYSYDLVETAGSDPNIDYDTTTHTVTFHITDNGYGVARIDRIAYDLDGADFETADVSQYAETPRFTNTYHAPVALSSVASIDAEKILSGRDMADGQFTFTLTAADDASAKLLGTTTFESVAASSGEGSAIVDKESGASFSDVMGALEFTKSDIGNVYSWTLSEDGTAGSGYVYDAAAHKIDVAVTDDGEGGPSLTVSIDGKQAGANPQIVFSNSYAAETIAPLGIEATKTLANAELADGQFEFKLLDAKGNVVETAKNRADGTVKFDGLSYSTGQGDSDVAAGIATKTVADGNASYRYIYTVAEDVSGLPGGIQANRDSFQVAVTATDNGDGTMTATAEYPDDTTLVNTYATNVATLSLDGVEIDRCDQPGVVAPSTEGKFSYDITADAGTPMPSTIHATNGAAGAIGLGDVSYTLADLDGQASRTFTYTVTQTGEIDGYRCAEPARTFTVTVANDGKGHLTAKVDGVVAGADFTFENIYSVDPGSETLAAKTVLVGGELAEGQFNCTVRDASGAVVATAANGADGSVAFPSMTWDAPGTYVYTIAENKGTDSDIEYDERVVTATVTVTQDDADDKLVADVAYSEDPTFVNVYKKAAAVATTTDDGGDDSKTKKAADPDLAADAKPAAETQTTRKTTKAAATTVEPADRRLAQTGDATDGAAVAVAACGGVALLGLAAAGLRKRSE
jgi:pilin isopeptide linkage protein